MKRFLVISFLLLIGFSCFAKTLTFTINKDSDKLKEISPNLFFYKNDFCNHLMSEGENAKILCIVCCDYKGVKYKTRKEQAEIILSEESTVKDYETYWQKLYKNYKAGWIVDFYAYDKVNKKDRCFVQCQIIWLKNDTDPIFRFIFWNDENGIESTCRLDKKYIGDFLKTFVSASAKRVKLKHLYRYAKEKGVE